MTTDPQTMIEEYIVESVKQGELLNISDIDGSDELSFSSGPVYTHFGGIGRFQFKAFAEALSWTEADTDSVLEHYGLHREDIDRIRV